MFDKLLDLSVIYSFDKTGFKRHCKALLSPLQTQNIKHAIVTGASTGIGSACAKTLLDKGVSCTLIARHFDQTTPLSADKRPLDMTHLKEVYAFASSDVDQPIDLLIHNAGSMPETLQITEEGFEGMFASQVIAPYILTKTLADLGKLSNGCRVIFVSSGGMYLQKLDLSDLLFQKRPYNKYTGYANAKRAQVILTEIFARKNPEYLFSAMHPGWVDTPGVQKSMPAFAKFIGKRLRSEEEGADTLLWLATTPNYPNGKFWFDRKEAKTDFFGMNRASEKEKEELWNYCALILNQLKEGKLHGTSK